MKTIELALSLAIATGLLTGCNSSSSNNLTDTEPNYKVKKLVLNANGQAPATIYASGNIEDKYIEHIANVLAGYLDNDQNGVWDNSALVARMGNINASIVLLNNNEDPETWFDTLPTEIKNEIQFESTQGMVMSDIVLCEQATYHDCFSQSPNQFDATYEEVLHLITTTGYSIINSTTFGENETSKIAIAMNKARDDLAATKTNQNWCQDVNGEETCQWQYTDNAWYSYDDPTCTYECQVSEYTYWMITSLLGIQNHRTGVEHEWDCTSLDSFNTNPLCNNELLAEGAVQVLYGTGSTITNGVFTSTTNPYQLPTQIPFGQFSPNGQVTQWDIEKFK